MVFEKIENNISKACTVVVFEMIGTAENLLKTMSLKNAF